MPDSAHLPSAHEAAVFQLGQLTAMAQAAQERHTETIAAFEANTKHIQEIQDDVDLIRTGELMQIRANITAGLADAAAETQALRAWLKEVNGRAHPSPDELAELTRLTISRKRNEQTHHDLHDYKLQLPWFILVGILVTIAGWLLNNLAHIPQP